MRSILTRGAAVCGTAAAALVLAAACSSSSNQAQPGPGSTTGAGSTASGKQPGGGSYSSSSDVVSALKTAGHACTPISNSDDTNIKSPGLQGVTACSISSSSTQAVTVTVFDNHNDAELYASTMTSSQASGLLIGSTSQRAVLGQNWVVLVPDNTAYAAQVSAALGGSVVGGSSGSEG
jgi:hypothetical protein